METTLIKIDIATIKKNDDYGSTQTIAIANKTIAFTAKTLPDYFIDGVNCISASWQEIGGIKSNVCGYIISEELIKKCFNEKPQGVEIKVESNAIIIDHAPTPKYSFKYENTEIICLGCGEKIMTDDLISEESADGEYYSEAICPKCGEVDCCDLVYQNIEDINLL